MLTEEERRRVLELYRKGYPKNRIAKELDISWDTVNRVVGEDEGKGEEEASCGGEGTTEGERDILSEYEEESRVAEYTVELSEMARAVEGREDPEMRILSRKLKWALENVGDLTPEVMERVRGEYSSMVGVPPREEMEKVIEEYRAARAFEEERGVPLSKAVAFVEEHRDQILERGKLEREVRELRKEREALMKNFGWLRGREEAYNGGYAQGAKDYAIYVPCSVCGGSMLITPCGDVHREVTKLLLRAGFGHPQCHEMRRLQGR